MPSLTEVAVLTLSGEGELLEVQSEACAWRILRIETGSPFLQELGRFTAAMPLLHLKLCDNPTWLLGSAVEGLATMAKAAAWLSQISNCPNELSLELNSIAAESAAGVISSLAPLSGPLISLALIDWPVSEGTLDELAAALPNVSKLTLLGCSISSSAWARMSSLTSVTDLTINRIRGGAGGTVIPLSQIIAFTSAIFRICHLSHLPSEADLYP